MGSRVRILHTQRQYDRVDATDDVSCRPDFGVLVYPAGFTLKGDDWKLRDYIQINSQTPPMFFAHSQDDRVPASNSLLLFAELKKAGVPAELHLYASGGHGYGMRNTGHPCNSWPDRCADWLGQQGWLKK